LTSKHIVLPNEDPAAFDALRAALIEEHHPANSTETAMVEQVAESYWRFQRAQRAHDDHLASHPGDFTSDQITRVLRYATTLERAWYRAVRELRAAQFARVRETVRESKNPAAPLPPDLTAQPIAPPPGFVSQNAQSRPPAPQLTPGFPKGPRPKTRIYDPKTGKRIVPLVPPIGNAS
jgi:hypothetical protein